MLELFRKRLIRKGFVMPERVVSFSMDMVIFIVLIGIILVILSMIYVNTTKIEEKAQFAGAPGVVRSDAIYLKLDEETISDTRKNIHLIMTNVEHEEGKHLIVTPVLDIDNHLYRPDASGKGIPVTFPQYYLPANIEGYFIAVLLPDDKINDPVHLSLWERACLEKIGFIETPSKFSFQTLAEKCSSSYLAAYAVKIEVIKDCTLLSTRDLCFTSVKCWYSFSQNKCADCNTAPSDCSGRESDACIRCPGDCIWILNANKCEKKP